MSYISFPENLFIMQGLAPTVGIGGALTSIPISLKNVQKLWAVCSVNTADTSAAVAIVPQTDTLVAFATPTVLPATLHNVPRFINLDTATSDVITHTTDGVNYTTAAVDALSKMVIFEIDPSVIRTTATASTNEDCFRISFTQVDASDLVSVIYVIQPRYPSGVANQTYIAD
jgi:hypothetical protein